MPPADLDEFADKVMLLAGNKMLLQRFAESARKQACEATWDKINNTAAWAINDAIEERATERAAKKLASESPRQSLPRNRTSL